MLATLGREPFSDDDWIFERKLDGERVLAFRRRGRVRLLSRNGQRLDKTYPELVDALERLDLPDLVADGEVVAFSHGRTSFERLQGRMQVSTEAEARASQVAVFYYLFDLVHCDGHDLTRVPLDRRKALLGRTLTFRDPLRRLPHRNGDGIAYHDEACRKGWEGIIAKKAAGRYVHGRSREWLKLKCSRRQELVIGGYTDPEGSRRGFGALLVGYHDTRGKGPLRYAGKVGTGYDDETLDRLSARLRRLRRQTPPFERGRLPAHGVHWVRPSLVAEIGFTEWTRAGRLRHPRFLGLRRDKDAGDVVRERAA